MAKLDDMRRRFPVVDRDAYERAYAEAELAARLGELVHHLRTEAGLTQRALGERMGESEEEVAHVEEGGPGVTLEFLDRLGRALGVPMVLGEDDPAGMGGDGGAAPSARAALTFGARDARGQDARPRRPDAPPPSPPPPPGAHTAP